MSDRASIKITKFISFNLSAGTYSIYDFNAPQIKNLRLVIPKDYTFMADNTIFIALGIQDKSLEKTTLIKSTLPPGSYKTSLDTSPLPISFSLHFKQINKIKNEVDAQPSSLLARIHVSNYKVTFSPIYLVFLELYIYINLV